MSLIVLTGLVTLACPECDLIGVLGGGAVELGEGGIGAAELLGAAEAATAGAGTLDAAGAQIAAQVGRAAGLAEEEAAGAAQLAREAERLVDLPNPGFLDITATRASASEIRAAEEMASDGARVELRDPIGTRAEGQTSDLVVDGVLWDVITPKTNIVKNVVSRIAGKYSQVHGGGVIVDLGPSGLTEADFGGAAKALDWANSMISSWGKGPLLSGVKFFGGR
ncbi:hypothetical protein [Amycolatopsis sp. WGS_07]|uniref:CdiA C-terminal domain-containing protein n=1 Tax=Amycolatopsis sp. WGS_07 TaxID=3076764 RepID=UPI00387348B3